MKILCISNGHGEDIIALQILKSLQKADPTVAISALSIVGEGHAYRQVNIPVVGPTKTLASGGFLYMDSQQLVRDIKSGLISLTLGQLRAIKRWVTTEAGCILAVGDIVPLLLAWWSGAPYAFIGTAKSEYHLRDEQGPLQRENWWDQQESAAASVYFPWERWLMARRRCRAVFPRDRITTERLLRWPIQAFDLGNPMMDDLMPTPACLAAKATHLETSGRSHKPLTVTLLPGSRPPEVYKNWQIILTACTCLVDADATQPLRFLAAITPSLDLRAFESCLAQAGWQPANTPLPVLHEGETYVTYTREAAVLALISDAYADCLHQANLGIAMAGTATEQLVGLGKPVITLPGQGPQFTPTFAQAQSRLLGCSIVHVEDAKMLPGVVKDLMGDRERLDQIQANGLKRMGRPGAARRIADRLLEVFEDEQ
ncbi:MAG: lipid-A-disaccharide synthase-related protein [Cyanobacteria bacterium P01_A01_bin.123]